MNNNQLTKGNEISKKISDLKDHLGRIKSATGPMSDLEAKGSYRFLTDRPLDLNTRYRDHHDQFGLKGEFINLDEFIAVYAMRVQAAIDELQKEFDSL